MGSWESVIEAFKQGVTLDDGYVTMPAKLVVIEVGNASEGKSRP